MAIDLQEQAAEALGGVLDDVWLPDEPNATRIRYSGGTENAAGELEGQTRHEHRFRLAYGGKRTSRESTGAGDKSTDNLEQAQTLEDVLEAGDIVEVDGDPSTYKVETRRPMRSSREFAYTVGMKEVESSGGV